MTPVRTTRPVLIASALAPILLLVGCGAVEDDPQRFQTMAEHVAAIDVPLDPDQGDAGQARPSERAAAKGPSPLRVSVMSPHDMWDARDAEGSGASSDAAPGFKARVAEFVQPAVDSVAPAVVETAADRAAAQIRASVSRPPQPRPEPQPVQAPVAPPEYRTLQLGAYSSQAGAQAAWMRLKQHAELAPLTPVFQPVDVDGRTLTRLKVSAPADAAASICRAAEVADPWCRRAG